VSIRGMTPVPGRVVQVLKDYLLAETALIDTEEGDSIVTPQIPDSNYFDYDPKLITKYPACSIRGIGSVPIEVRAHLFGDRTHTLQRIEVLFTATIAQAKDSRTLEKFMQRYVTGAVRVLAVVYDGLQTISDPVRWGDPNAETVCEWTSDATYGPEVEQGDGSIVRTATLPLSIRRIETR